MNTVRLFSGQDFVETDRWPMVLQREATWKIPRLDGDYEFYASGRFMGYYQRGRGLTIWTGYALDGYSPVVRIFGKWRKLTPVPKYAQHGPEVLHDFTRQFLQADGCPWTREDSDDWFFDALIAGGEAESTAGAYHEAVSGCFGSAWIALTRRKDPSLLIRRVA